MVDRRRARHYVLQDLFIGLDCVARIGLRTNQERLYRATLKDLSGTFKSSYCNFTISRITEPVGIYNWMDVAIAGRNGNITTGERRYGADNYGSVVLEVRCAGEEIVQSAGVGIECKYLDIWPVLAESCIMVCSRLIRQRPWREFLECCNFILTSRL